MSTPSRILSPEEAAALDEKAKALIGTAIAESRRAYPGFDSWHPDAQAPAILSRAVQSLLRPEVHAAERLNLDMAAFGIGLAIGCAAAAAGVQNMTLLCSTLLRGVEQGRAETLAAAYAMPTQGSAQ